MYESIYNWARRCTHHWWCRMPLNVQRNLCANGTESQPSECSIKKDEFRTLIEVDFFNDLEGKIRFEIPGSFSPNRMHEQLLLIGNLAQK